MPDPVTGAEVALAHLSGVTTPTAPNAPPPQPAPPPPPRADDDDDDEARARRAAARRRSRARRRSDDDRDPDDDDDDDRIPDEDGDEDEDEDEMSASSVTGQARARERRRCAALFGAAASSGIAGAQDIAAHFAFKTAMPRRTALAALRATLSTMAATPRSRPGLDQRMAAANIPTVPSDHGGGQQPSMGQRILAAYNKAQGRTDQGRG